MKTYKEMYLKLFNAVTSTQQKIDQIQTELTHINFSLQRAQAMTEELFMEDKENVQPKNEKLQNATFDQTF